MTGTKDSRPTCSVCDWSNVGCEPDAVGRQVCRNCRWYKEHLSIDERSEGVRLMDFFFPAANRRQDMKTISIRPESGEIRVEGQDNPSRKTATIRFGHSYTLSELCHEDLTALCDLIEELITKNTEQLLELVATRGSE